ncbi:MAG: response regulator, partial [Clostridia bacterium]|nr:response regulator [Clostridia bacterium]
RTIRTVLTQALTRAGCRVHATGSLSQLLRWVEEGRGDLVITDVMMPDGNGIDMIPAIRKARPDLPVIVISAQNTIVTAIRARGPRILFDSMHGSSTYPLTVILNTARCTVDQIHGDKDAYFGGMMPAPTEDTMAELRNRVVYGRYDLGIAVDGDGDRLGIIDGTGRYISANEILVLLYTYLHEYKGWRGPVVRNMSTTHLLDRVAESFGETCYEVPVGFKHISSKIDEVDAVLGGESSGGLTVRGHIHGKDSVYSSALFVEMICKTGKLPSEMMAEISQKFGTYLMKESNVRFSAPQREQLMQTIFTDCALPKFAVSPVRVSYLDGCAENGLLDVTDVVTLHFYGKPETMNDLIRFYRKWLTEKRNGDMPLWVSESGTPGQLGEFGRPGLKSDLESARDTVMRAVECRALGVARFYA